MAWDFSTETEFTRTLAWVRELLKELPRVDGFPTEHIPTRRAEAERRFGHLIAQAREN